MRAEVKLQAARSAAGKGVPFCLSTVSVCAIDEVASGSRAPMWFQLYVMRDREFMRDLVAKAKLAGCTALVVTVDMPVPGTDTVTLVRACLDRSPRPAVSFRPPAARPGLDVGIRGRPTLWECCIGTWLGQWPRGFYGLVTANFDPTVDWRDLENVRELWDGPLIIREFWTRGCNGGCRSWRRRNRRVQSRRAST